MPDHCIKRMQVHLLSIPAQHVHSHGSGDVSAINIALLELTTNSGITGWGEASPWPVFTGTVEANAYALHKHIRPIVEGCNPIQVEVCMAKVDQRLVGHPEAKAALETALLDITGQIAGLSIAELLGGIQRTEIPMSFSIANPNFDQDLNDIEKLYDEGIRIFKLKTGFNEHSFDVMRLETLRNKYDQQLQLRIDYNQGLSAHNALRITRDLEAFNLDFIEQPVKMHEKSKLAEITAALDTPVMADESVFNAVDAIYGVQIRIADIYSLKIMKSGGLRKAMDVASIARAAGIEVYGGCMFESSIAHTAGAQLMAAIPNLQLGCEFYMSNYYAEEDIAQTPFKVHNGCVEVPTTPGLGCKPCQEKMEKYRTERLC